MAHLFKILCTSDIHGCIYPHDYASGKTRNSGLARLKTLIDRLRDEDTILIDNGDTLQGSPLSLYHEKVKIDEPFPLSQVLKLMRYDLLNLGNHDFDYGKVALFRHLQTSGAECFSANVFHEGKLLGPQYVTRTLNGKKLVIFALTTQYIPNWAKKENIEGFAFTDAYETARELVDTIREKEDPDYVVCVYHGGFESDPATGMQLEEHTGENEGYKILTQIEGIDAFLCGHQHKLMEGKLNGVPYLQPGYQGAYLACLEIDTDTDEIKARLIPSDLEPDREVLDLCQEEEDETQRLLDTPIGHTDMDLKIKDETLDRLYKNQFITLANMVQFSLSNADLSASSIGYGAPGFNKDITLRDLTGSYPFPNTLFVKQIDGKSLREYLEYCALFWEVKDGKIVIGEAATDPGAHYHNYDMVDGIEYTIKVSKPYGQRIVSLTRNGKPVRDDDLFTIAVNSYRAAGGGDYPMIRRCKTIREIQVDIAEAFLDYIQTKKEISFTPVNNISVIV